jgi:hypothetical protein
MQVRLSQLSCQSYGVKPDGGTMAQPGHDPGQASDTDKGANKVHGVTEQQ